MTVALNYSERLNPSYTRFKEYSCANSKVKPKNRTCEEGRRLPRDRKGGQEFGGNVYESGRIGRAYCDLGALYDPAMGDSTGTEGVGPECGRRDTRAGVRSVSAWDPTVRLE